MTAAPTNQHEWVKRVRRRLRRERNALIVGCLLSVLVSTPLVLALERLSGSDWGLQIPGTTSRGWKVRNLIVLIVALPVFGLFYRLLRPKAGGSIHELDRYCVVCGKMWGPKMPRCCRPGSLVGVSTRGAVRKETRYYDLQGNELSETSVSQLRQRLC